MAPLGERFGSQHGLRGASQGMVVPFQWQCLVVGWLLAGWLTGWLAGWLGEWREAHMDG